MDIKAYQAALFTLSDEELAAEHKHVWHCLSQHWDMLLDSAFDPDYVTHDMAEAAIPQYQARLEAVFEEALSRKQALAQTPPASAPDQAASPGAWTGRIERERAAAQRPSPVPPRH